MIAREDFNEIRAALTHIRAALFILATLLLALSGIGLACFPQELHSVPLRLDEQRLLRLSLAGSPTHRLDVGRDGRMAFDGRPLCDLLSVRQELDTIANRQEPVLEVMPDPELRYERFIEIMAVAARAAIRSIKLDLQPRAHRILARRPSSECGFTRTD